MPSRIFTLNWQQYGDPHALSNPETIARKLRYQALGQACREQGMKDLLFAHHADDQAETSLMRLSNKYLGRGLAGMHRETRIPECQGLYGVDSSGTPRILRSADRSNNNMLIESGGVTVLRPLLDYTKARLIATCEEAGTRWVEDQTNKDPSLTLRNAVRSLHESDRLPIALRRPNLRRVAESIRLTSSNREATAHRLFQTCTISLRPSSGTATCTIPDTTVLALAHSPDNAHIKALLLRKLLLLVAPARQIDLATLSAASARFLLPANLHAKQRAQETLALASAAVVRAGRDRSATATLYALHRTPPSRADRTSWPELRLTLPPAKPSAEQQPAWSAWQLWDGRYWLRFARLSPSDSDSDPPARLVVRFLRADEVQVVRRSLPARARKAFNEELAGVKGNVWPTLPVIALESEGVGARARPWEERVVALPSVGWGRDGWVRFEGEGKGVGEAGFLWDVRYKEVDGWLTKAV